MIDWRENKTIGIIAGAVFLLSIILIAIILQPKKIPLLFKCEQCETEFETKAGVGTKFPIACPKCNAKAAYPARQIQCLKCGWTGTVIDKGTGLKPLTKQGLAALTEEQKLARQKAAQAVVCPKCGSPEIKVLK
jgi:Zn finger protein HypA/HybF involved in hydrogenase expression